MGSSQSRNGWREEKEVVPGSELEWQIKRANPKDLWTGVGREEGTWIWRIVKFKVTPWPKGDYGKFHEADAYIVLHSHRVHEKTQVLNHEIHFWIGEHSTADKYGTAAFKTVELYNHLDGMGKQHREVQGRESGPFKSYFPSIEILEGGSEPGFKEVQPEQYKHRLLQFKGTKNNIIVREAVPLKRSSLNSGDVFVLDLGLHIIQWNGGGSNKDERFKAKAFVKALQSNRGGRPEIETVEESAGSPTFNKILPPESGEIKSPERGGADGTVRRFEKQLYRIGNKRKGVTLKKVTTRPLRRTLLHEDLGYLLDTGFHVFFWVGRDASQQIKARGFTRAKSYVQTCKHPFVPLTRLDHINESDFPEFNEAFQ